MGDFNKVFSVILGLIVVIVFLAIATRRLNFTERLSFLKTANEKRVSSPTPTRSKTVKGEKVSQGSKEYVYTGQTPEKIPSTGVSAGAVAAAFTIGAVGVFFRKKA